MKMIGYFYMHGTYTKVGGDEVQNISPLSKGEIFVNSEEHEFWGLNKPKVDRSKLNDQMWTTDIILNLFIILNRLKLANAPTFSKLLYLTLVDPNFKQLRTSTIRCLIHRFRHLEK